jgi:LmbE family N-acetylglucosaminyl deacetylase
MASAVLLSPHLDDVVFSCWHVLRSSQDVVVINVFTAVPAAGTEPPRWDRITGATDPAERMRLRLEEDAAALALAGRRAENLGFVDSQYRDGPPADGILDAVHERLPAGAEVLAPASIGGHSDHEHVRDVGLGLAADGRAVSFYADLPYATDFGWPAWVTGGEPEPFLDVDAYWALHVPAGYEPRIVELSEHEQRAKLEAMRAYRSQFPAVEAGIKRRLTHPELIRFEVLWERLPEQ